MRSQKVVIPATAGIQGVCNDLKFLDSRFRGNDGNEEFSRICEFITFYWGNGEIIRLLLKQDYKHDSAGEH